MRVWGILLVLALLSTAGAAAAASAPGEESTRPVAFCGAALSGPTPERPLLVLDGPVPSRFSLDLDTLDGAQSPFLAAGTRCCALCPVGFHCKYDPKTGTCACYIRQPH